MSKYSIQFQKGLSLFEFNSQFSTREQCEEKVFKLKWGDRFTCPKCGGTMEGDGYTTVFHCEYVDLDFYNMPEPDADPVFCDFEEE